MIAGSQIIAPSGETVAQAVTEADELITAACDLDLGRGYREHVFERQKELGIVPADAELSRHDPDVPPWDSLSDEERALVED